MMMKTLKKILRSQRGAAIEMALFLMLIVFLFSTLITIFCLSAHTSTLRQNERFAEDARIDQIGEKFVKQVQSDNNVATSFNTSDPDYKTEVTSGDDNTYTLKITDPQSGKLLLTVEVSKDTNNDTKIVRWQKPGATAN